MAVLQGGASGASVAELQRRLEALGYNPGPVDGQYGAQTLQAMRAYQQANGLAPDGVAGPETLQHLGDVAPAGASTAQHTGAAAGINPEEDPSFLAFQRAQGFNEDQLRAQVAMARSRNNIDYANQLPVMAEQNRQASENIANSYESRGLMQAGNEKLDQLRQKTEYARQQGAADLGRNRQNEDSSLALAQQVAQNRVSGTEQGLTARKSLASYNATARGLQ